MLALHWDQSGLFAISHLATTMFLTATIICALNMGGAMVDRTRQQRKADAAAQTLGTWKARNMNAVVAHRRLIGELLSLAMIHHAIGGDDLNKNNRVSNTSNLDSQLKTAYFCGFGESALSPVRLSRRGVESSSGRPVDKIASSPEEITDVRVLHPGVLQPP